MKLISMLEFIRIQRLDARRFQEEYIPFSVEEKVIMHDRIVMYAKFLETPISMNMFISENELADLPGGNKKAIEDNPLFPELEDKVFFKDLMIKYEPVTKKYSILKKNGFFVITGQKAMFDNNLTIDSLVHRELELTDYAVKLIFGGNV